MPNLYLWGGYVLSPHLNTVKSPGPYFCQRLKSGQGLSPRPRNIPLFSGPQLKTRQGRGLRQVEGTPRARAGEQCPREGGREDRLVIPVELRPRKAVEEARDPRTTEGPSSYPGGGVGCRSLCEACLELVQGAEAEVRLLRQGRLTLLAAARGSGRCSTENAFTGQPHEREQRTPRRAQHPATPRRCPRTTSATRPAHLPCWSRGPQGALQSPVRSRTFLFPGSSGTRGSRISERRTH